MSTLSRSKPSLKLGYATCAQTATLLMRYVYFFGK